MSYAYIELKIRCYAGGIIVTVIHLLVCIKAHNCSQFNILYFEYVLGVFQR